MNRVGKLLPLLAAVLILAAPTAFAGDGFEDVQNRIHEKTLSNGLKVILFENHDAPVVSFVTQANVGASDEVHGITGLANLQLSSLVAILAFFAGGMIATHLLLPWIL